MSGKGCCPRIRQEMEFSVPLDRSVSEGAEVVAMAIAGTTV